MNKKKIKLLVFISLIHFIVCVFSGALNWNNQTVIVSTMSFFVIFYSYRFIIPKLFISVLLVAPFYLLYIISSVLVDASPLSYPVWICGLFVLIISVIFIIFKVKPYISISILIVILLAERFYIYPNYFSYFTSKRETGKYSSILNLKIVDENNNEINTETLKGKVILFDIWNSSCFSCIKEFPELQSLSDNYKTDTSIRIISLDVPLERDKGIKPTKFTDSYSFEKMYLANEKEREKLPFEWVPLILIIDKNLKCRYAGELNLGSNIFTGNAKKIINKLKTEL